MIHFTFLSLLILVLAGWMVFVPLPAQSEQWIGLAVAFGTVTSLLTLVDVVVLKSGLWKALNRFSWMTLFWLALWLVWLTVALGWDPGRR
jgi:hypothetical protein